MGTMVRRGIAAGLMLAALMIGSMAMSDTVSAQSVAAPGVISTTGGPRVTQSNLATTPNSTFTAPPVVPAFNGFPIGGNYFGYGGFGGYPFYGYQNYGYGYGYPYANYGYGFPGYGFGNPNLSGNVVIGCTPSVSFTPAFGFGFGCYQVNRFPTAQSLAVYGVNPGVAYPPMLQSQYQVGR